MEEIKQADPGGTQTTDSAPKTSIGLKLTLIVVGLMLLAFFVYSLLSIRVGQGTLVDNLRTDLTDETAQTSSLIRTKLTEAQTIASNLATAVESGAYDQSELDQLIKNTLERNDQLYGVTVGYEPNQFAAGVSSWAPYYYRLPDGTFQSVQLSDFDYFDQEWYRSSKQTGLPIITQPYKNKSRGDVWVITLSVPFRDKNGNFRGAAAVDIEFTNIQEILTPIDLGKTGYSFLIQKDGTILQANDINHDYAIMIDSMYTVANKPTTKGWLDLINGMTGQLSGFTEATDINGNPMYIAYQPIGLNTDWSLALVYPREEIQQQTGGLQRSLLGYSFLLAIIFGAIMYYFTRTITTPLRQLTEAAEEISSGNLQVVAPTESLDEVGTLGETFNRMTEQLRDMLSNLERRITERTVDLEIARRQSEWRANQLLSIGQISKIINNEQKMEILLPLITRLVSERFGFYHTGIFLIDDARLFAVLRAANSLGGQNMLRRGHKLKVGESGMVGYVARSGQPRIALDVGLDAVFFNNPDLPATRSEMALPLKFRDVTIGVLDVQSEKPGAFTDEDTNILSILADQVAIAIENTRLLEQTQQALDEAQMLYRQNLQKGWNSLEVEEGVIGYYQSLSGGKKLTQPLNLEEINQAMYRGEVLVFHADGGTREPTLVVPIKLREQIIGVMHIKAPSTERNWTDEEIRLTEAVSERLSLALENARLIEESQRQVIKEQTITEITGKIGASINLENVMLTAVEELGRTIPGSEVVIKLKNENSNGGSG